MSKAIEVVAIQRGITYHFKSISECRKAYGYKTKDEFLVVLANDGVHFDGYTTFDYDISVSDETVERIENKYKYKNRSEI